MSRPIQAAVLMFVLAGAACSGSDANNSAGSAAITEPATSLVTTEVAVSAETVVSTTTTTTTTVAPTTTIDEDAILAEAEAAFEHGWSAALAAYRDPGSAELRADIELYFADVNLEKVLADMDSLLAQGIAARPAPDLEPFFEIFEPVRFINDEKTRVELGVCNVNSDWYVEVGNAPDGSDALVRDDPVRSFLAVRLELVDGVWKGTGGTLLQETFGEITCDR